MSKKSLTIILIITLVLILTIFKVNPQIFYNVKHKITNDRMSTFVNKSYRLIFDYPSNFIVEQFSTSTISLLGSGDTKPYIIQFETVPYHSFQTWYNSQKWPDIQKNYIFTTSTRGQTVIISNIDQTLYTMIRPGILVTITNAVSSEKHPQSDKILLELAQNIRIY